MIDRGGKVHVGYICGRVGGGVLVPILGMFWLARNGVWHMVWRRVLYLGDIGTGVCSGYLRYIGHRQKILFVYVTFRVSASS